jgi:hypothetical protein
MAAPELAAVAKGALSRFSVFRDPLAVALWGFMLLAAIVLLLALLVAIVLPYGEWDAMAFGTWSRLVAEHWPHVRFESVGAGSYHRPLFYVLQGWIWWAFGFHQSLGRVLSLLFSLTLVAGVAWTAAQTVRTHRAFAAALAAIVIVLIVPFERYVAAGLSDIPTAAMVAVTAALLFAPRLGRAQLPLLAVGAALSGLAKPSALPALVGLVAAILIGPRIDLRRRILGATAIVAGTAAALTYDIVQARYFHTTLSGFLTTGTRGFYAELADETRRRVLLDGGWLGGSLRVLLVFAIVYAVARLGLRHQVAVMVALPAALAWSWLGPHLAGAEGVRVGILGAGDWSTQVAVLALAASLLLAAFAPDSAIPDRLQLARALVWAAPPFLAWSLRAVYDARLLAPAWPPLVLLIVWALLPVFAAAASYRKLLVAVPAAALVVLGAYAVYDINGLGKAGWHQLRVAGFSGLGDAALMRDIALGGDFAAELRAVAPQVDPRDRILTFDQRLRFFYLSQVTIAPPLSCGQLRGYDLFVLLESDEIQKQYGDRTHSRYWEGCAYRLTKMDERPGAFAIFVSGTPRPVEGGCGASPTTDPLIVQFGPDFRTRTAALSFLEKATRVGFVQARVVQLGCAIYRVTEPVPDENVAREVVAEARTVNLHAQLIKR